MIRSVERVASFLSLSGAYAKSMAHFAPTLIQSEAFTDSLTFTDRCTLNLVNAPLSTGDHKIVPSFVVRSQCVLAMVFGTNLR